MTGTSAARDQPEGVRIVDVVFGASRTHRRISVAVGLLAAVTLHAGAWGWASVAEPSLESWAADMWMRIEAELDREQTLELAQEPDPPESDPVESDPPPEPETTPEPAPEEPPAPPPEPSPEKSLQTPPEPDRPQPRRERQVRADPLPPAQAGAVLAREPGPNDPLDLTADTFVVGSGDAYAGGVTTGHGTNPNAVPTRDLAPEAQPAPAPTPAPSEPDRSRPVAIEGGNWSCAWPREADEELIDEQTVMIRVIVRPDGRAESARVVGDPGFGFGAAAVQCALRTHFVPARGPQGKPIRSESPPIRVRFTR